MAGGQRSKDLVRLQVAVGEDKVWNRARSEAHRLRNAEEGPAREGAQGNSGVNRYPEEENGEEGVERCSR